MKKESKKIEVLGIGRTRHGDKGAISNVHLNPYTMCIHTLCGGGWPTMQVLAAEFYNETNMVDRTAIELPSELKGKKFRIRKLTPRECFRLMGVDDKDIDKMQAAGVSNSAQYKLAGNSIVVDVLFHIFRKMFIETYNESQQLTLF